MKTAALALLLGVAAAQPHGAHGRHGHLNKKHHAGLVARDVVTEVEWVTEVQTIYAHVGASTTFLVTPGLEEPAPTSPPEENRDDDNGQFVESPVEEAPEPTTTSVPPPPPPPAPKPTTTSKAAPPPPPPAPETTTAAPPPPPVQEPEEEPEEELVEEPVEEPVEEEETDDSNDGGNNGGGGGGNGGNTYAGELTYYHPGLGACGEDDSGADDSENIVALSHLLMGTQSNGNPMCGQTITISTEDGKTASAVVKDKCMGCAPDDIDVSPKVFKQLFGSVKDGRVPISWSFDSYSP